MATKNKEVKKFLTYKGKPLVRRDKTIYYGNPEDKYIIVMTITDTRTYKGLEMATNVLIELKSNEKSGKVRVVKKAEREGLSRALDIAIFWLEDALGQA